MKLPQVSSAGLPPARADCNALIAKRNKLGIGADEVIEIFNTLIAKYFNGKSSVVKQKEVMQQVGDKLNLTNQQILDNHYLDVEEFYREAGWHVKFDKPSYGDSDFESYFEFTKPSPSVEGY